MFLFGNYVNTFIIVKEIRLQEPISRSNRLKRKIAIEIDEYRLSASGKISLYSIFKMRVPCLLGSIAPSLGVSDDCYKQKVLIQIMNTSSVINSKYE